ncbi:MAG: cytochrome-c peroxidase [Anaerolineae bacterium]|nr:cytochrome-c peroxidase [Anaerolineae bacterium]
MRNLSLSFKPRPTRIILIAACLLLGAALIYFVRFVPPPSWTADEIKTLRSLSLSNLPPLAPDKSNLVADDPRAVALGHQLFFDKRFSADGTVSCASCHIPELNFQDPRARGRGLLDTRRRTQSVVGSGYLEWFFWDGRKDSLWSQALAPLEHANEQGGDRTQYARLIAENYRDAYEALFGALPDLQRLPAHAGPAADETARAAWDRMTAQEQDGVSRVYANMGKALAAYQRKLLPGASRFDKYVDAVAANDFKLAGEIFSADEREGLRLFIGKAGCVRCHNTPLLTDDEFHNTGVPQDAEKEHDLGRAEGVVENFADEFKCWSEYSDDAERDCPQLRYMRARAGSLVGAFKTPSLRKTQFIAPFMHNARYTTLPEILDHYNRAPAAMVGVSELKPLGLTPVELKQLEAFLGTLTAPVNAPPSLLSAVAP